MQAVYFLKRPLLMQEGMQPQPLAAKCLKKMLLLTVKSVFSCHDTRWALVLLRTLFFTI